LGNAKGVVAAGISILIFKNPVTMQGAVGYAIALFGVALYSHVSDAPPTPPGDIALNIAQLWDLQTQSRTTRAACRIWTTQLEFDVQMCRL